MIHSLSKRLSSRWTYEDRQRLLVATYGLPGEHTIEFELDAQGHDYATVTPGYPDNAPGRFTLGWSKDGYIAVTDCTTGAEEVVATMTEGTFIMKHMERF